MSAPLDACLIQCNKFGGVLSLPKLPLSDPPPATPGGPHDKQTVGTVLCNPSSTFELSHRERKISPKFFRPKFFRGRPRGVRAKMFVFPGLGGPDRSFWPDVRRDVRPKTSVFGLIFVSDLNAGTAKRGCLGRGKALG